LKRLNIYLAHNIFNIESKKVLEKKEIATKRIEKEGFHCLWLFDENDSKRNLLPKEVVGRCIGILSMADYILVLDADDPGWGKVCEMYYAYSKNIPVLSIWQKSGKIDIWVEYLSEEIFDSLDKAIEYLKMTYV